MRSNRNNLWFTLLAIASSSAAVGTVLSHFPSCASALCLVTVIASSMAWMLFAEYSKKSAVASTKGLTAQQLDKLAIDWKELWFRQQEEGMDVLARILDLEGRVNDVTSRFDGTEDRKLNKRCAAEAYTVAKKELGLDERREKLGWPQACQSTPPSPSAPSAPSPQSSGSVYAQNRPPPPHNPRR